MTITILPDPLPDPLAMGLRQLGGSLGQQAGTSLRHQVFGLSPQEKDIKTLNDYFRFRASDTEHQEQFNARRRQQGLSEFGSTPPEMRSPQGQLMMLNNLQSQLIGPQEQAAIEASQARSALYRTQAAGLAQKQSAEVDLIRARAAEIEGLGPITEARAQEILERINVMREDVSASKAARERYEKEAKETKKRQNRSAMDDQYISLQRTMDAWVDILESTTGEGEFGGETVLDPQLRQKALVAIAGLSTKLDRLDAARQQQNKKGKRKGTPQPANNDPLGIR